MFAEVIDGGWKPFKPDHLTSRTNILGWGLIGGKMINDSVIYYDIVPLCFWNKFSRYVFKKFWEVEEPLQKVHLSREDQLAKNVY